MWLKVLVFWMAVTAVAAINRPVYKVGLRQKGYAQFLQYDLVTPPLIEFTFCTWVRLYNLSNEQTLFTYIVNSNKNMIRLWVDPGGRNVQLAINGWLATTSPIEMMKDVWKHVCISYQSDFGAWALYIDARLVTCGASQALHGFILPPGGSISIGYGTSDNGVPSGVEGEIFGANMILTSTIERNYTMKQNPRYKQKHFKQNTIKKNRAESDKYIILKNLKENKIQNSFETTPHRQIPITKLTSNAMPQYGPTETTNERDISDFAIPGQIRTTTTDPNSIQFWHLVNDYIKEEKRSERNNEPFGADTKDLPKLSEFETPPLPTPVNLNGMKHKNSEKAITSHKGVMLTKSDDSKIFQKTFELSEIEIPPPPQTDKKVYGQWVSSQFAGSVLNHLRNMRFNKNDNPIPSTIPLYKTSDAFPYASEFKLTKLKPPSEFERRSLGLNPSYSNLFGKRRPQYNVQILEDDIREKIKKSHSRIKVKNINVASKGESKLSHERFNREAKYSTSESSESIETERTPQPFTTSTKNNIAIEIHEGLNKNKNIKNLLTVLPFLKTLEDLVVDSDHTESKKMYKNDIYTRSLTNGNKWHNTKSYSNDYTPRQINVEPNISLNNIDSKIANDNNKHPAIKLNYKHKGRSENTEHPIRNGQYLAKTVSSQAEVSLGQTQNPDSVSIQKFIYDPLDHKNKDAGMVNIKVQSNGKKINNFDKHVKIGNALNELHVIGRDELQKKHSFEGGDVRVPDINLYRSDIDKERNNAPPSLSPKVCKNVELYDRVLYIQPDESVDLTYFLSPVKLKNHAIEFIQQNYKMCSLDGSIFEKDPLLYLDWSKTPVRLFGGAYLQTTTDLCGFF